MANLLSQIQPPLTPTAGPWTTTPEQLSDLYTSEFTGAVTVQTSLLNGFAEDPAKHQHTFFDARSTLILNSRSPNANSTLNSLGYSPIPLRQVLELVRDMVARAQSENPSLRGKPVIVSVTGTPAEVAQCHVLVQECAAQIATQLFMEVNLSCPNIHNRPPPAYDEVALREYLLALQQSSNAVPAGPQVPVGLKLPPYTYLTQFHVLRDALLAFTAAGHSSNTSASRHASVFPVAFLTSTNTLGSCLLLVPEAVHATRTGPHASRYVPGISSEAGNGIGGVGGAAIHALALGNVHTLRHVLDESGNEDLQRLKIIGVGGVQDLSGYQRMCAAGADVVGIGSAVLRDGADVFARIGAEAATVLGSDVDAESQNGRVDSALEALRAPRT